MELRHKRLVVRHFLGLIHPFKNFSFQGSAVVDVDNDGYQDLVLTGGVDTDNDGNQKCLKIIPL